MKTEWAAAIARVLRKKWRFGAAHEAPVTVFALPTLLP